MAIYLGEAIGHVPGGEQFTFGTHFNGPPGGAEDAITAFVTAVTDLFEHDAGLGNTLQSHVSDSVGVDDVTVAELDELTGRQVHKVMATCDVDGTNVGETLPPQVALAVSLRTNLATKGGRGRFYLPPLAVGAALNGQLIVAAQDAAVAGAQAYLNVMLTAGFVPVVFHRATLTADIVVRVDVGNIFDTQRRRRNKLVELRQTLPVT